MVSGSLYKIYRTIRYLSHSLLFSQRSSLFSSGRGEYFKKSHVEYEMILTNVYKQVVVIILQADFVKMS
jgi:hypothetical protein